MTQDEILRMACEAGLLAGADMASDRNRLFAAGLVNFANLITAREREACVQVCEEISKDYWMGDCQFEAATRCVAAIRAGGVEPLRRRECLHQIMEPAAQQPGTGQASTQDGEPSNVELRGLWYGAGGSFHGPSVETSTMPEAKLLPFLRSLLASRTEAHEAPAAVAGPSDDEILALNAGEIHFSESPSKYPWAGHGTQYHAGAPGVLSFARAVLARWGTPPAVAGEPVAWRVHPFDYGIGSQGVYAITSLPLQRDAWLRKGWKAEPLYTTPQPTQAQAAQHVRTSAGLGIGG